MSVSLPNGALVAIAASYGVPSAMTALTNANPAVASLAAGHGIVAGDVFEIEATPFLLPLRNTLVAGTESSVRIATL